MVQHILSSSPLTFLDQFWWSFFFMIPTVLVARAVVAGTRYSPILIIVVFGLSMGFLLTLSKVTQAGMPEFPLINTMSRTTIIALAATFFVGGQQLRRVFSKTSVPQDESIVPSTEEFVFGTSRTQFFWIVQAFFVLLGIEALSKVLLGNVPNNALGSYYPLIAYLGVMMSILLTDNRAIIRNKRLYLGRGLIEIIGITGILIIAFHLSNLIRPFIPLPQIFFVMLISVMLGIVLYRLPHGPTLRSLLFAGISVVLSANFLVGGSLISGVFELQDITPVLMYGFFGQIMWMFGGISLLILLGRTDAIRNLAPGMAGALSHAGLTGACTAGDFGEEAARRAPVMINIPFLGHIFVFSILALSIERGELMRIPVLLVGLLGAILTAFAFRTLRNSEAQTQQEITGLMLFSFGWQLTAIFFGFLLVSGFPLAHAAMAKSSALSHFGLFAALQGGMFGPNAGAIISFVFAMPFLVHPFVFFLFGRAMENDGKMPHLPVYILAMVGMVGVLYAIVSM